MGGPPWVSHVVVGGVSHQRDAVPPALDAGQPAGQRLPGHPGATLLAAPQEFPQRCSPLLPVMAISFAVPGTIAGAGRLRPGSAGTAGDIDPDGAAQRDSLTICSWVGTNCAVADGDSEVTGAGETTEYGGIQARPGPGHAAGAPSSSRLRRHPPRRRRASACWPMSRVSSPTRTRASRRCSASGLRSACGYVRGRRGAPDQGGIRRSRRVRPPDIRGLHRARAGRRPAAGLRGRAYLRM